MHFISRLSLSARLTLLAFAAVCPLVVLVVVSHFEDRDAKRNAGEATAASFARGAGASLEGFARDLDSFTAAAALVIGSNDDSITQANTSPYLQSLISRYPQLSALFITDLNGSVVATSTGNDAGFDVSARPYFMALKGGSDTVWTGGLTGLRSGEITAAFGRVIKQPDGSPKGFLIAAFQPSNLASSLPPNFPKDANLFIVDQNGQTVFSATDPDFNQPSHRDVSDSPLVQQALGGKVVALSNQETPFDSGKRYGEIEPIPHMKWAIGYTRSQAVLNASVTNRLYRDLAVVGLVILLLIGALLLIARQMTRPLVRLASVASGMALGQRTDLLSIKAADPDVAKLQTAFSAMSAAVASREDQLRDQARILGTLERVGARLASELDFEKAVQAVTDAGIRLTEAQFGAFFYNRRDGNGDSYILYTQSGTDAGSLTKLPVTANAELFGPGFGGSGLVRVDDVDKDERYANSVAAFGLPPDHVPVRSYLAVAVTSGAGEVMGGLFFGHGQAGAFNERHEQLATGIGSWAAIALDNARLYTEAQAIQADLREANRAKDEFLGLVSHELRTPTTTIYGGMRMLETRRAGLSEANVAELVSTMSDEAGRLVRLIENLLAFARTELGREIDRQPLSVNESAGRTVETFLRLHPTRKLDVRCQEDLPIVLAEPTYFEQVLQNLLSNADKYSSPDKVIDVRTRQVGNDVQVVVLDNGPGVAENETSLIFESFYRSDRTAEVAGNGLGLTVCKRLIEALGGKIWAHNRPEGGLEVGFSFPVILE